MDHASGALGGAAGTQGQRPGLNPSSGGGPGVGEHSPQRQRLGPLATPGCVPPVRADHRCGGFCAGPWLGDESKAPFFLEVEADC